MTVAATSRELVLQTLHFQDPQRAPRELWVLPIAPAQHPAAYAELVRDYPNDIVGAYGHERARPPVVGNPHGIGQYTDEWGATFVNIQQGIIGEVKQPLIENWDEYLARV